MTRAVAGKDLRVLWASPIPYVVAALFHLLLGLLYVDQLRARQQALSQPLFPLAGFLLIALVPLVCMRALAEEARTGSLDVLLAVPVPTRALVLGKWLAAWVTTLAVLAPALLFIALLAWFGDPDLGPVVAGFVGLVLFSAALTAIGILASALTSSLPVAAVVGFFVSLLLWFAHASNQAGSTGGVLSALSFSERLRSFAAGAIDTSDVGFFVLLAAGALAVALVAVDSRRLR
jgi:ABC-2 type transport system permease protein